jgi:hypothetical protein
MFWYVILLLLSPLYLLFGLVFRGEEAGLVLALHHQVLIPRRQVGKRPSPVLSERLALVLSSLLLGKEKLRETLLVVTPETLVGSPGRTRGCATVRSPGRCGSSVPQASAAAHSTIGGCSRASDVTSSHRLSLTAATRKPSETHLLALPGRRPSLQPPGFMPG